MKQLKKIENNLKIYRKQEVESIFNYINSAYLSFLILTMDSVSHNSTLDSHWGFASFDFNPLFYVGFVICKSPSLIFIYGVVSQSVDNWNRKVEEKIIEFSCLLHGEDEKDNSHFLIFGPWTNLNEFPSKIKNLLQNRCISGSFDLRPRWILALDAPLHGLLAKVHTFFSTLCKTNWNLDQSLQTSVGFFLLSDLILHHSFLCVGQISDWTEEIEMTERNQILVGGKRSRVSEVLDSYLLNDNNDGNTSRKKRRVPGPFEAGPSNWTESYDKVDGYWRSTEEMDKNITPLMDQTGGNDIDSSGGEVLLRPLRFNYM
ncbi:hypothetical protein LIER_25597 [Lithospermum erythrorhizon]|uniref:Uncharacterized protein n=1 Tax=Lithospermum erythrorhizon TaxID=34254 RepID=A0AAV3R5C1_LITER